VLRTTLHDKTLQSISIKIVITDPTKKNPLSNEITYDLKLEDDHIVYTRNYITSVASNSTDADAVANRLLKNQEDIGNAIKPYYGDKAGENLTGLLKDHIMSAVEILKAAKSDNSSGAEAAEKKWFANANDIAGFLSTANPNLSKDDLKNMLEEHLKLTKSEAVAQLNGDFEDSIAAFDKVKMQAMDMSDTLADAVIKQFPEKFS
jgi:hypothetical protein